MTSAISLPIINSLDKEQFVEILGEIYERSPWVAKHVFEKRPFHNITSLHESMVAVVQSADTETKLALLRAHPELAGKEARDGNLTHSSTDEQSSAGLNALTSGEMGLVAKYNADYQLLFGFPFIIAVKNHTKESIFSQWIKRLSNSPEKEFETCLQQVFDIAQIRLDALITT